MVREIRLIGRVSKWGTDKYAIVIPTEVVKKYRDVLEEWNRSSKLIIIELKELDGMVRT